MSDDLRALVNRCLQGDQSAMLDLVRRYQGPVFGLCYRMLGHREDAEDAAQETFVRVLKNLDRWDPHRDFEPWLLAIAGNRCRTALATRRRRPRHHEIAQHPSDPVDGSREADQLAEELDLVLQLIRPEYREAFVLFHHHELNYDQIAEAMSRPLGTVKTWIHRARVELIRLLRQREVIEEPRHALP